MKKILLVAFALLAPEIVFAGMDNVNVLNSIRISTMSNTVVVSVNGSSVTSSNPLPVSVNTSTVGVREVPISRVGTGTTVSVSTFAWTNAVTSSSLSNRACVKVSNPSSNNASFVYIPSTSSVIPGEATTVRPGEIETGEGPCIAAGDSIYIWLLSLHTSAENAHVQEWGQ